MGAINFLQNGENGSIILHAISRGEMARCRGAGGILVAAYSTLTDLGFWLTEEADYKFPLEMREIALGLVTRGEMSSSGVPVRRREVADRWRPIKAAAHKIVADLPATAPVIHQSAAPAQGPVTTSSYKQPPLPDQVASPRLETHKVQPPSDTILAPKSYLDEVVQRGLASRDERLQQARSFQSVQKTKGRRRGNAK